MKIIRITFPLLIMTLLAFLSRRYYHLLPNSINIAIQYLPVLLILLTTAISLHFNQIRILCYIIIISSLYYMLSYGQLQNSLNLAIFASFAPVTLILTMLLKQQNIFSVRALSFYSIFIFLTLFSLWLIKESPEWAVYYLSNHWLAIEYFTWTLIPQSSLLILLLTFISLISIISYRQDSLSVTAIAVFIILIIGLQFKLQDSDLIILICSGLLLCLINVLQESWAMAYLDELTQLPGRRALREKLQSLLGIYSIAMIDIDFFKKFNDSYGHETGDDALRMIASKLEKITGGGSVFRYGGEEFTIVFTNKSLNQVKEHLETVRKTIESSPFVVNRRSKQNKNVKITISIGVADSIDQATAEETLKKADKALYKAKKKGRNCMAF